MIVINTWSGLATNASPYTVPPTSAITQVNVQSLIPGELSVRSGLTSVAFTTHTSGGTQVVQTFHFQHSTTPFVVYQNASGRIYVGKGPS